QVMHEAAWNSVLPRSNDRPLSNSLRLPARSSIFHSRTNGRALNALACSAIRLAAAAFAFARTAAAAGESRNSSPIRLIVPRPAVAWLDTTYRSWTPPGSLTDDAMGR